LGCDVPVGVLFTRGADPKNYQGAFRRWEQVSRSHARLGLFERDHVEFLEFVDTSKNGSVVVVPKAISADERILLGDKNQLWLGTMNVASYQNEGYPYELSVVG